MQKITEYQLGNRLVKVHITTHNEFVKCFEDVPSPFKHGKTILNPQIDVNQYEKVVVKCFIEEEQRLPIVQQSSISGESICHTVVEEFIAENWKNHKLLQLETINCSHFEQQYKYLVIPKV